MFGEMGFQRACSCTTDRVALTLATVVPSGRRVTVHDSGKARAMFKSKLMDVVKTRDQTVPSSGRGKTPERFAVCRLYNGMVTAGSRLFSTQN
jgi:hypothetical protein